MHFTLSRSNAIFPHPFQWLATWRWRCLFSVGTRTLRKTCATSTVARLYLFLSLATWRFLCAIGIQTSPKGTSTPDTWTHARSLCRCLPCRRQAFSHDAASACIHMCGMPSYHVPSLHPGLCANISPCKSAYLRIWLLLRITDFLSMLTCIRRDKPQAMSPTAHRRHCCVKKQRLAMTHGGNACSNSQPRPLTSAAGNPESRSAEEEGGHSESYT